MSARITGFGAALPPSVGQDALWDGYFRRHFNGSGLAKRIFESAGVRERHTVVDPTTEDISGWSTGERMRRYAREAPPLGEQALRSALDSAGLAPAELGLLAVTSCTGYSTPGLDVELAARLDLPADLRRLLIGHMGCYAALPGLGAVSDFVAVHGQPAALLCLELTSLHVQPPCSDPEQMVAHALFSDAAAVVIVEPAKPGWTVLDIAAHTDTDTRALMTWEVTDLGFRMGLSGRVPDALAQRVRPVVEKTLARNGVTIDEVVGWVVHPGGPKILDTVESELGLAQTDLAASRAVLADHGNCSSATVLMVLQQWQESRAARSGDVVVALAFGPGLTLYTVILRWSD